MKVKDRMAANPQTHTNLGSARLLALILPRQWSMTTLKLKMGRDFKQTLRHILLWAATCVHIYIAWTVEQDDTYDEDVEQFEANPQAHAD